MFRYQFAARIVFIRYLGSGTTADELPNKPRLETGGLAKTFKVLSNFCGRLVGPKLSNLMAL